ncbi:MAG: hypothetical protein QOK67_04985 [Nitrososphaeraceae archaeon]|jgi:hypothetical protein|nr:hypothetical protein [Nitrososphaeraceae archaeon]
MFTLEIFSRSFLISLNIHIISFGVAPEFSINFKIISLLALGYNNKNIFNIKYPKSNTKKKNKNDIRIEFGNYRILAQFPISGHQNRGVAYLSS